MAIAYAAKKALAMTHWAQLEERGIIWGMQLLLKVYLLFGRRVLQFFLYPVVSYYWLINRTGRQASRQYLERISRFIPEKSLISSNYGSYLHFICFANAIIDKLAVWCGAITLRDVNYQGRESVAEYLSQRQGVLIFGSHLGNMEVMRAIASVRKDVTLNVLVHTKHAQKFNDLLNRKSATNRINLMQVTETNAATAMLLQDKIDAGEIVVIAADRIPVNGQSRVSSVMYLGSLALFPQGPYILASLLKCPVFTLFCLKHEDRYTIYFDHFCDKLILPRNQREAALKKYAQAFADRMQSYCLKEPLQWFNFYDFWQAAND